MEWRAHGILLRDGDIKKAYDFVSHKACAEAARNRGMDEVLILAWLRAWRRMKSVLRLDAVTPSEDIDMTRSLPLFNLILDTLAVRFTAIAKKQRVGKETSRLNLGRHHPLRR